MGLSQPYDEPASTYTRAELFQKKGTKTPVSVRFSTVAGGRDSSEAARDPRGFAVKLRTEDGNWDLVGNNLPVFFIRDAIKFPDLIHSQKPDPVTHQPDTNRWFDFVCMSPEAMHMVTWVMSPRGIPASYRQQDGFGVNTYRMVNAEGEGVLVKYHWKSQQGVESLTQEQAEQILAKELGHASRDLFEAIERGDFPRWELNVQIMADNEHPELSFDPLDDTKTWPEGQFPLRKVGVMTLNRNVDNFFDEAEQIAFGTGVLVDGLDFSDDKMLVGRTFSYSDTQRHRVGPNYLQLPVNKPVAPVRTNQRDGGMSYGVDEHAGNPHVNYEPSTMDALHEADESYREYRPHIEGHLVKASIERTNDYGQAGERYRTMPAWEREDLVHNLVTILGGKCQRPVQERMVAHLSKCDDELGRRVADGIGIDRSALDLDALAKVR